MGRDEFTQDTVRDDTVRNDGVRNDGVHNDGVRNNGMSPVNEYYDEKTGHHNLEKLDQDGHNANEHHYETKIPQVHGVSELPMYPRERVDNGDGSLKEELEEAEVLDLYKPFPLDPNIPHEEHILTVRAIVVGLILGSLVNCSNVYLGMWTCYSLPR